MKEATARIKINKLLEAAGWRFFADEKGPANIQLEPSVTLTVVDLDALGENFEKPKKGFIDFLLLNEKGFPFIVLEAKSEDKHPLVGKEQAREYAKSQKCRFVLLSNGNLHYFWDLEQGGPETITTFPTPSSVAGRQKIVPMPKRLITEVVEDDYVVLTQRPSYKDDAGWKNEDERQRYIDLHGLRFLRPYQKKAIHKIQERLDAGKTRFLLEMATGTGKTLTSLPSCYQMPVSLWMPRTTKVKTMATRRSIASASLRSSSSLPPPTSSSAKPFWKTPCAIP